MSWTKSTQFHFQSTCCPLKVQIFLNTERIFPLRECEYGFPLKYIQFNIYYELLWSIHECCEILIGPFKRACIEFQYLDHAEYKPYKLTFVLETAQNP